MTCQNTVCLHIVKEVFLLMKHIEVTFSEVMRWLSQEEHEWVAKGEALPSVDAVSPSAFVAEVLEPEEPQYVNDD